MRISAILGDDGYLEMKDRFFKVYLNGRQVKDCIVADEEEGYIEIYKTNRKGDKVYKKGEPERKRKTGKVKIKWVGK